MPIWEPPSFERSNATMKEQSALAPFPGSCQLVFTLCVVFFYVKMTPGLNRSNITQT